MTPPTSEGETVTEYAIAIMLPPGPAERVLRARQTILGDGLPYAPHLTVRSPFAVDGDRTAVFEQIAEIAAAHRPFTVEVTGLGSFHGPVMNVVFLQVRPTRELVELHAAMSTGLKETTRFTRPHSASQELDNYVPHITIAADLTERQLAAGLAALRGEEWSFSFTCTHVTLGISEDSKTWSLLADFPLSGAPEVPHFVTHDTLGFEPN